MNTPSKAITSLLSRVAPLALLLLSSANLYAQQAMSISLNGAAEVPPVATSATGSGQITVFTDHRVSGRIKTSGFVPTMAHIHKGVQGIAGGIIFPLSTNNPITGCPARRARA